MATDHPPVPTARQVAERFVTAGVDPGTHELYKLYALSVVIEMPFAPPGMPKRYETSRDELAARFSAPSPRRYEEAHDVVIHETTNPEVVIVEYSLRGMVETTQEAFDLPFVMVMTVRDGQVVHSRDYSDPIVGARILNIFPQVVNALTAGAQPD